MRATVLSVLRVTVLSMMSEATVSAMRRPVDKAKPRLKQLMIAIVFTFLIEYPYIEERAIYACACARLIKIAVKVYKKRAAISAESNGVSADGVKTAVEGFLKKQAGHWCASMEDVDSIMEYVTVALPLVLGVQRGRASPFCGVPPDDASSDFMGLVAGGRGRRG
ncbi:hypothetical protein I4F81_005065 [Pyropia yezoensis]|uniref:Uncharacterized protein n=1 Tax=Pyropia yezoensis TaxID=2788 RepID=A0ACC3BY84_PYRYE|nr:hypothetical protein I4F81_005065 [Neopyropia yezoensis]